MHQQGDSTVAPPNIGSSEHSGSSNLPVDTTVPLERAPASPSSVSRGNLCETSVVQRERRDSLSTDEESSTDVWRRPRATRACNFDEGIMNIIQRGGGAQSLLPQAATSNTTNRSVHPWVKLGGRWVTAVQASCSADGRPQNDNECRQCASYAHAERSGRNSGASEVWREGENPDTTHTSLADEATEPPHASIDT